jgi:hypothetical protein
MGLIPCPECRDQVSESARACPHCGYPLKEDGLQAMWNHVFRYALRVAIALPLIATASSLIRAQRLPWPHFLVFLFVTGFALSAVVITAVAWIQGRRSDERALDGRHSGKVAWGVVGFYVLTIVGIACHEW